MTLGNVDKLEKTYSQLDERDLAIYNALSELGGEAHFRKWFNYVKEKYGMPIETFRKRVKKLYQLGIITSDPPLNVKVRGKKRIYKIVEAEPLSKIVKEFLKPYLKFIIEDSPYDFMYSVFNFFLIPQLLTAIVLLFRIPESGDLVKKILNYMLEEIIDIISNKAKEVREEKGIDGLKDEIRKFIELWYTEREIECQYISHKSVFKKIALRLIKPNTYRELQNLENYCKSIALETACSLQQIVFTDWESRIGKDIKKH